MNRAYLIGIIFCKDGDLVRDVLKYHDIPNKEPRIETFMKFAAGKPFAKYVNFYYKTTSKAEKGRNYAFRRYIK